MKHILWIITCFFTLQLTALKAQSQKPNYKNWVVDLSQSKRSHAGITLSKIELTDDFTIVSMQFRNTLSSPQYIEACNSFHIRAYGRRVARFVKAEGIPTRNTLEEGFECADLRTAKRVAPFQIVDFKVYFTRIPSYVSSIDIVEYDGRRSCEFDIFDLNISEKKPLPTKEPPAIASKSKPQTTTPIPAVPKPDKPKITPNNPSTNNTEPNIASKTLPNKPATTEGDSPTDANKDNTTAVSDLPKITLPEKREVKVKKEYTLSRQIVQLELWDNDKEDGDKVSIMLNGKWILRGVAVTKQKRKIEIPLIEGVNTLVLHADNLGSSPPNTAALSFNDGLDIQTIILNSDFNYSEAINIIRKLP